MHTYSTSTADWIDLNWTTIWQLWLMKDWCSENAVQYFCSSSGCALQNWDSCSRNLSELFGSQLHMLLSWMEQRLFLHSTFLRVLISDLESLQLLVFLPLDVCTRWDCQIFCFLFLISYYCVCLVCLYIFICLALRSHRSLVVFWSFCRTVEYSANMMELYTITATWLFFSCFPVCIFATCYVVRDYLRSFFT